MAALGQILVQRYWPAERRETQNNVASYIYAAMGVAYGVFLAFIVVVEWQNYQDAKQVVYAEANELTSVHALSRRLPEPQGSEIQRLVREYVRVVMDEEWALMDQGRSSPRAERVLDQLRDVIEDWEPKTPRDQVLYDHALSRFRDVSDNRRLRLLHLQPSINAALWAVLIFGLVVIVGFTYLFGLRNTLAHALMVGALAALLMSILFVIALLDYAYRGDLRVGSDAFRFALAALGG